MLGKVWTLQKCPTCNKPFQVNIETGIYCSNCQTRPLRYFIDARKLKAGRLYSDPQGHIFDSFRVAQRQLESMRRDYDQKIFNPDDWIPKKVREYRFENLINEWIRGYELEVKKGTKSEGTLNYIKQAIKDHLIKQFMKYDIRDIREIQIKKLYHNLLEAEFINRFGNKYTLAPKTIHNILNILHKFLSDHITIIKIMPLFPKFTITPKRDKKWLSIEIQLKVLFHIPDKFKLAFELAFDTGMRPGELRALRKRDIMSDGLLIVSRAFSGKNLRNRTKTGAIITHRVSFHIWSKLAEHVRDLAPDNFIFTQNGIPYSQGTMYKAWNRGCKKADVPHISLYQATRHSAVSQIRQQKENEALEEAAKKTGHTNKETTRQYYFLDAKKEIK